MMISQTPFTEEINLLIWQKERIKNEILDQNLTWQSRMELYRQVQLINLEIEQLQGNTLTE